MPEPFGLVKRAVSALRPAQPAASPAVQTSKSNVDDTTLIEAFKRFKKEAFADRYIFERQWTRVLHYRNNRQWLAPYTRDAGWRDARLAKGIPRPVTNKCEEIDNTIRAMFASVDLGVEARPISRVPKNVVTAGVADDLIPILHGVHDMATVMDEHDFWFVNCGTGMLHTYWDASAVQGLARIPFERCEQCGLESRADAISEAKQRCPSCKGNQFAPAIDPATGEPRVEVAPKGAGVTVALSPLEYAFPLTIPRWVDVPGLIRLRWRPKRYYEEHPELKSYVDQIRWQRASSERSLQIFKAIPLQSDLGSASLGTTGDEEDGIAEYEWWMRPTIEHPDGLVARFSGDDQPIVIHLEESESLPGPLPYKTASGNPLWTFALSRYKSLGGRVLGSGVHDSVLSIYDKLNRLDSLVEMIITRVASPNWMVPKGAEVQWLGDSPGLAGLVLQWNAQMAGPNGRPERVRGEGPDRSFAQLRQQFLDDIDRLTGAYDILKGAKPTNVQAFSAMQLLVERGESRFASASRSRGDVYRQWAGFALELERAYGPDERTHAVLTPGKTYAFQTFKKADLTGDVLLVIEDGTNKPKTALGQRAMVEHLNQMQFIDKNDTDQKHAIYRKFGATDLIPSIDIQVQGALQRQEAFEQWIIGGAFEKAAQKLQADPSYNVTLEPLYPLAWKRWYTPQIARQEFLKWVNSDTLQELRVQYQGAFDGLLEAHLLEIDLAGMQQQQGMLDAGGNADAAQPGAPAAPGAPGKQAAGSARSMTNSNRESGAPDTLPGGPSMQGGQAPV